MPKDNKKQPLRREARHLWKEKRSVTLVYILLRTSVVLVMLAQIFNRNFENVFLCVLTLLLFMMPSVMKRKLDVELPNTLEIIILLFIYAAEILGEIGAYYVTFPYWDTVLHTLNGFLCAAIGFSLVDILNRSSSERFNLSPLYMAIVAFCFSMTVGVIWEFFECTMDQLFFLDMQKDTVVSAIGSIMLDAPGGNHPVVDRKTRRVFITSQNHGFAVDEKTLPENVEAGFASLFDGSLQGMKFVDAPAMSFQGHPEASPGPHDIAPLFDRFAELMRGNR